MFFVSALQQFHLCCSCFQIDDIFGSTTVNGKENGRAAPQPNRVWKYCHTSFMKLFPFVRLVCRQFSSDLPFFTPPQMSLTLEEKQRLAKEQEQAAKLRNQQPLAPQTVKPAPSNTTTTTTKVMTEHVWVTSPAQTRIACDDEYFSILCCRLKIWQAAFSATWHPLTACPWPTQPDQPQCRAPPSLPSLLQPPWWAPWGLLSPMASIRPWAFRLEALGWACGPQGPDTLVAWPQPPVPQTLEPSHRIKEQVKPPTCLPWTIFLPPASPKSPSIKWVQWLHLAPMPLGSNSLVQPRTLRLRCRACQLAWEERLVDLGCKQTPSSAHRTFLNLPLLRLAWTKVELNLVHLSTMIWKTCLANSKW